MGKRPPVVVLSYSSDADDCGSRCAAIRVPPGRRPRIPAPAPALEQSPSGSKKKPRRESSAGRGRRRASVPAPSDSLKAEFDMLSEDFSECLNDLGMSGVGKSSLVHLILKGSAIARPAQTVGCAVGINHVTYGSVGGSSSNEAEMNFFVELWDVSGHERYKACRSIFYTQINGVIFVYDLSQRKTKTNLNKWAVEVAETGTFSAPLGSGGPGGLPVPYLVIANKVDLVPRDGTRVSSGSLVAVARQWVEKQGLLPSSEELPLRESFPGSSSLVSAAKEARYDKEAVIKFFRMLIRRRYFSNDPAAPSPWSFTPREDTILPVETLKDDVDSFQRKSYSGGDIMYDGVAPLPAQRNHTPLPTLNPQQPVSSTDNYRYHRFSSPSLTDISSNITG